MKKRKFAEGGGVREGQNPNIGDDVRARAMRFIRGETELSGKYYGDNEESSESPRPAAPRPRAAAPRVTDTGDETERLSRRIPAPVTDTGDETERLSRRGSASEPVTDTGDETERLTRRVPEPDRGAALRDTERKDAATRAAQSAAADARNVAEIENARGKLMSNTNRMGVRAAQQMEDKGSIYSSDFGKPRAVREAESKTRRMPLPRSQRMFQGRRQMDRPTSPGGYAKGGSVSSASNRADGIAKRGKTRGRIL